MIKLTSLFVLLSFSAFSQNIQWQKTLGGSGNEIMQDIYPTSDGNYIVICLASFRDGDVDCAIKGKGKHDTWVIKMASDGEIIWQQCYGGTKEEGNPNTQIIQTSDGGYLFQTETWSNDYDAVGWHGSADLLTMKIDSLGNTQWKHSFGGSNGDVPRMIVELSGKRYAMIARTKSNDGDVPNNSITGFDAWLFVTDSAGNIILNKMYGGNGDDDFSDILILPNGNFAIFGQTSSTEFGASGTDGWLLVVDTLGNIVTNYVYGQANFECFIAATKEGNGYMVAGETFDPTISVNRGSYHNKEDFWAVKLDSNFNMEWQGVYGGSAAENLRGLTKLTGNAGYYLSGTTLSNNGDITGHHGGKDFWMIQISMDGTLQWQKTMGGTGSDYSYSITNTGIIIGGTYSNNGDVTGLQGDADGWIVKIGVSLH